MAMIACNRETSSQAPAGLDFFTSINVDSSDNSSEGSRSRKLRIESMGRMKFDSYATSSNGNSQHFMMEGRYADNSWGTVLRLHIGTAGQDKAALQFSNSDGNNSWLIGQTNHSTDFRMNYGGGPGPNVWGTTRFRIDSSGNFHGSSSNDISDQRLKKDISTITNASDKIKNLRGVTFKWQERAKKQEGTCYGFIAQEMDTVIPDLVCKTDGLVYFDKEGEIVDATNQSIAAGATSSWDIHMSGIIPVLVESLKEALTEIETLKTKVAALEGS